MQVNQYMLDILNNLTKMHKVLSVNMETGQLEVIFKEAFRTLITEIEAFFSRINTESSKFAKTRARLDLTQIQRVISGMQFESGNVSEMAEQKIKSLINSKCGGIAAASAATTSSSTSKEKEDSAAAAAASQPAADGEEAK